MAKSATCPWPRIADQPLYKKLDLDQQHKQQPCEIDNDCFQHGLDSDRKHPSIAHRRCALV